MICNCAVALNAFRYAHRNAREGKTLLVTYARDSGEVQLRYLASEFDGRLSGAWRRYAGLQTEWLETSKAGTCNARM